MTKKNVEPMYRNYAAIDVGTSSVRLLIKRFEKDGNKIRSSKEQLIRIPLRLGLDVFKKKKISKDKEKELTRLMRSFSYIMKIYDVTDFAACATSALRDAKNGMDVVKRIKNKTGVRIKILAGMEEAKAIYNCRAVTCKGSCMYVDVGGGSTEICLMNNGSLIFARSYDIGTLRILCNAVLESEWKQMENDLSELIQLYPNTSIVGSGGNINKMFRLVDLRDKKQQRMSVKALRDIYEQMKNMTVDDRVRNYGIRYDRADVIVPAALIFMTIADIIKSKYIYVPTVGLSDGIINTLFERRLKKYGNQTNLEEEGIIENKCNDDTSTNDKNYTTDTKDSNLSLEKSKECDDNDDILSNDNDELTGTLIGKTHEDICE